MLSFAQSVADLSAEDQITIKYAMFVEESSVMSASRNVQAVTSGYARKTWLFVKNVVVEYVNLA